MVKPTDRYGAKTKVIRIDPNAYDLLTRYRREGETLSDAIRRLYAERRTA